MSQDIFCITSKFLKYAVCTVLYMIKKKLGAKHLPICIFIENLNQSIILIINSSLLL